MKSLLLSVIFLSSSVVASAQSLDQKMKDIEGKWSTDANGSVTITRVVEQQDASATDLFMRALNYFSNPKNLDNSSVAYKDAEEGLLVVKGTFKNVHQDLSFTRTHLDANYQFTVDVKDGKARIKCTLSNYDRKVEARNQAPVYSSVGFEKVYPANVNAEKSILFGNAFHKSFVKVSSVMDVIEKELKSGQPLLSNVNENW